MDVLLDSGILRGESVGIKAYGEKYVVALKTALAAYYLKSRICLDVADVHSVSRRIGKLYQRIELLLAVVI